MNKRGLLFKNVEGRKPNTNVFDMSHEKKLSGNMGKLIPVLCMECLPGEKVKGNSEMLIRLAPLMAPLMHRVNAYIHFFAVPHRIIWDNFPDFITGGKDGKAAPVHPYLLYNEAHKDDYFVGSLPDYFGIPPINPSVTVLNEQRINSLPFRAYQTIYNEYYRDQTLTTEISVNKGDGAEPIYGSLLGLRSRQWEKDYFTSAQITTQRGDDVLIPTDITYKSPTELTDANGDPYPGSATIGLESQSGDLYGDSSAIPVTVDNIDSIASTINDLRTSIVLQQWLEKNMRAGGRYVEQILSHFGKRVPDYRLQRPELIGGGKQPIVISEVLNMAENVDTALGKQSGHGISVGNSAMFNYTCDEHCFIIGILSVIPRSAYYQGIPKLFTKVDKFDYPFPEFAHIGEQPVLKKELFVDLTDATNENNNGVFGYQGRYAEYKYIPDSVHGEFRTSLEYWHLGRKFSSTPELNNSFTECVPDTRIYAVQDDATQKMWIQIYNSIRSIKPLPVYGTPVL